MTRAARSPAGAGGIKSVVKVLDILEYLADAGRPVGASEVARAVGFHVSTTHRLLRTLASRGYVDQHAAQRNFVLGPQLHALGSAYAAGGGLVQIAVPELEALRDALGADRAACVSREITKLHEEHARGSLGELAARFAEAAPRGECTIVVSGGVEVAEIDVEAEMRRLIAGGASAKDAAQRLMVVTGKPRRVLYQLALAIERGAK